MRRLSNLEGWQSSWKLREFVVCLYFMHSHECFRHLCLSDTLTLTSLNQPSLYDYAWGPETRRCYHHVVHAGLLPHSTENSRGVPDSHELKDSINLCRRKLHHWFMFVDIHLGSNSHPGLGKPPMTSLPHCILNLHICIIITIQLDDSTRCLRMAHVLHSLLYNLWSY